MKLYRSLVLGGVLLIIAGLALMAASPALAQEETPTPNPVGEPPTFLRGFYDAWVGSAHAATDAEAFNHWNSDGEIPVTCARCHSTPGYQDYLGADGSAAGVVDAAAPIGTVINCDACHNSAASTLSSVTFPSGVEVASPGPSARCMVCHQGRESGASVDTAVANAGLTDTPDTPSADLGFVNIHYLAAAASLYGSQVHSGYEYAGKSYQGLFIHTEGMDQCISCHDQHTLQVKVDICGQCHEGVTTLDDVEDIRMNGSLMDYDGDGNITEGISGEVQGLLSMLYQAMQNYASEVAGSPIVYDENTYPYWFIDTNNNGTLDADEATNANAYKSFTPRLLEATYNYQFTVKDPGSFAHNAKYHIELLYDSIADLNSAMTNQVDLSTAHRDDAGHFDATAQPFRHWDSEGEIPGTCAKCHSAGGLAVFLANGVNIAEPVGDALTCNTCHDNIGEFTLYTSNDVVMPSGLTVTFGQDNPSNLCLNCHQARESTVSVNAAITNAGVGDDEVSASLRFLNSHYFGAGATIFGTEAKGAYEFSGKEYLGRNEHTRRFDTCADCHNEHSLQIRFDQCSDCHENVDITSQADVHLIRADEDLLDYAPEDYNGNGDVTEPIEAEVQSFKDALLAAIQAYGSSTAGTAIAYNGDAYPYWFIDANGNGTVDEGETDSYASWTPNLLRAAYNYQFVNKDPGAFAHNPRYVMQVLYDSIEAVGGDVSNFIRPPMDEP